MKKGNKPTWDELDMTGFMLDGFVMANNQIMREIAIETNPQTALLYLTILSHRNTKTNQCYPSKNLLARELGVSVRTIGSMITELHDLKAIKINSGKKGFSNSYYFPAEDFYEDFDNDTFQASPYRRKGHFKKQRTSNIYNDEDISADCCTLDEDPF